jgi:hypothetical protein
VDRRDLLEQLDRLTGTLAASPHTPPGELERLRQVVGRELPAGPAGTAAPAPRIFRRDTAFRSGLLSGSVPEWGAGMAPSASFGPFVDEQGMSVWLDLFQPTRLVSLTTGAGAAPLLRVPIHGTLAPRQSYRIESGSVWIASDLIAHDTTLHGYYTGLRITGGSLELSQAASVTNGQLVIPPVTRAVLTLDLDQPTVTNAAVEAGADAAAADVELPRTLVLRWQAGSSALSAADATCTVFGCATDLTHGTAAPVWVARLAHILVPYRATTRTDHPLQFWVTASGSALCTLEGGASIEASATGWLLPAVQADPLTLGNAAGIGAICIGLQKGLSAGWKDLHGRPTALTTPAIIVEPGLVTVLDFNAANATAKQRWTLWRNANNAHASDILLTFGKSFPFIFITSTANSEAVFFFCTHVASLDRPVDANGKPFSLRSNAAFAGTVQNGSAYRAVLFDNDLFSGADAFEQYSIALRNALFMVSAPRSLTLFGDLEDGRILRGTLTLTHDIALYLPTLPDPYVASYTPYLRDAAELRFGGRPQQTLTGFIKWPNTSPPARNSADADERHALVYYKLTPPLPVNQNEDAAGRSFRINMTALDHAASPPSAGDMVFGFPARSAPSVSGTDSLSEAGAVANRVAQAAQSGALQAAVEDLERNPLLVQIPDKTAQVRGVLDAALQSERTNATLAFAAYDRGDTSTVVSRLGRDSLMLLDVSSHADQMGVSFGPSLRVYRDKRGDAALRPADAATANSPYADSGMRLQIMNMDVVTSARNIRAAALPQVSWEPVLNIPLPIEGSPPLYDTVTVTPGLIVYDNDGIPTLIQSESPHPVPISPLPVTHHAVKEFNDRHTPRAVRSLFTLPFGMVAQANFTREPGDQPEQHARLDLNMPYFDSLRGGLQIKARAPASAAPDRQAPSFDGWTLQLDNIRWSLFGIRLTGSTLGNTVRTVFNGLFSPGGGDPKVPLERIELSGYGASIFSNWFNTDAVVADVSQTQFDVIAGRAAHEVVQVRSMLYPFGVHVVRTITLMRSNNGYVFRSDSGWKAESDGFYDFSYRVPRAGDPPYIQIPNPYEFHTQPVKGVSNVREIRDFPDGGMFKSFFTPNDPDLPTELSSLSIAEWQAILANITSLSQRLDVLMQAVVFDADVHLDNVVSGGSGAGGSSIVQSRKMLGYVQLAPPRILVPARIFADLLRFQNGSLGGPVDCTIDVAKAGQRMRISRVDVNPARNAAGKSVFVTAARGSLILPPDGSWSTVKQQTSTGDVQPVGATEPIPLIKPNASPNFLVAHPADVYVPSSNTHYGVLQSTGTQKLLFDVPQFTPGVAKLHSAQTYFADAYKLLNSKGAFPNIANALGLTAAERSVDILGEGLMKMAERKINLDALLPSNYQYPFVDEPGVLRIYAEYSGTTPPPSSLPRGIPPPDGPVNPPNGSLTLGIDSSAAALEQRWKAALSSIRIVVDLGPFQRLMWVDGNFNAGSGVSARYDKPHLQFGPVLQPVIDILQVLATLSGDDFDRGMSVGMSNSADNREYKLNCSKEIPVIKFPSPEQLTLNPNPPLKLEAGLKVGFYFNELLALPTDLKQLVPACGAYVEFYGRLEVQCFTLAVASVYGVGQVTLGIAADSKAGITLHMKFGFGAEVVVGLPVVANVSVLYMAQVEVSINDKALDVAGLLMFRGSAEICGGLVAITIQIEAGGCVHVDGDATTLVAQVTFSIDVCVLWVIDIDDTEHWEEQRQIA